MVVFVVPVVFVVLKTTILSFKQKRKQPIQPIQFYTTSECLRAPAKVVLVVHVVCVVLKNNHIVF